MLALKSRKEREAEFREDMDDEKLKEACTQYLVLMCYIYAKIKMH